MADVITRFKLETTQYDSKLRDAAKGLKEVCRMAELGGKNFTGFNQKAIDAARALGTIESGANNTKDRLKDLVGSFNDTAKAYNNLSKEQQQSDFGKALAESLTQLNQRIKDTKNEIYSLGDATEKVKSSGLFGEGGFTGMLAVTGGNLLAAGIQKLGSEMADTIQQGIELARQGEGIRLAFERLNRPDLLDKLKEATHGTVSEIELMKAAVQFNDFKLPVEQLGTMLEFAQKKAKDTGQSVDYMVQSIVTGLGRKSLMILDNLGLSAANIKEKMAETGDMTKAVAEIIKEQMSEAGEYVETAADRAARAAADATNEMERLGREAQPFAEAWAGVWNELKIGGMDFLTTVLGPIARSAQSIRNILNGDFKLKPGIENLANGSKGPWANWKPGTDHTVKAPGGYVEITDANTGEVIGGQHFDNLNDKNAINAWRKSLRKKKKTTKTTVKTTAEKIAFDSNKAALAATVGADTMPSVAAILGDAGMRQMLGINPQQTFDLGKDISTKWKVNKKGQLTDKTDKQERTSEEMLQGTQTMVGSLQSIVSGIEQLGIELPQGMKDVLGALQVITGIVGSIQTIITVGQFLGIFNHGGVVRAANGWSGVVPGNHYSGDMVPALLNSNELVLNQAQTSMLATKLSGNGIGNLTFEMQAAGEQLLIVANNTLKRRGKGEIATWR